MRTGCSLGGGGGGGGGQGRHSPTPQIRLLGALIGGRSTGAGGHCYAAHRPCLGLVFRSSLIFRSHPKEGGGGQGRHSPTPQIRLLGALIGGRSTGAGGHCYAAHRPCLGLVFRSSLVFRSHPKESVWRDLSDFLAVLTQPNRKICLPNQINERENITRHCVRDSEKGMLVPWQPSDIGSLLQRMAIAQPM